MFKIICKISWASLSKRRNRSILVVVMIAVSLWALLFLEGIYDGMTEQMIDNAIRSGSGDISIGAKGYRADMGLDKLILNHAPLQDLQEDSRVKSITTRLYQDCLIATAHNSQNGRLYGISLESEKEHGGLESYITEGEYSFGNKEKGAIIGYRLAKKLKITIGKKLVVSAQDSSNEVASTALRVTGIIKTKNMALDEIAIFLSLPKARKLLSVPAGYSQISAILFNEGEMHPLQQTLSRRYPELEIFRWDQIYPALMQSRVMMQGFNLTLSLLIFFIAGLGIFGVILVSVLERIREFGILLAIGTSFNLIRCMVLAESFLLGFIGLFTGSLLGGLTLVYFKKHGLDLSAFSEGLEVFGVDHIFYADIRLSYFISSCIAVSAATFLSVLLPLRILKKSKPIEAISKH